MSSTITISSLYALTFVLLVKIAISSDPLFSFCSSSENFTSNSPYEQNLNNLIGDLYFKTPPTGFGQSSVGQYQARIHGLSLCRGDVSSSDCKTCFLDASSEILKRCPNDKAATIWYDTCLLKYSNVDFFGEIDNQVKYYMWNLNNVSNSESFNLKVRGLLGELTERAHGEPQMYEAGELELEGSQKIYGMVQCTRDLSSLDCKKCLDVAISDLPSCCDGKQGGRIVGGSCNIRYETFPFVTVV